MEDGLYHLDTLEDCEASYRLFRNATGETISKGTVIIDEWAKYTKGEWLMSKIKEGFILFVNDNNGMKFKVQACNIDYFEETKDNKTILYFDKDVIVDNPLLVRENFETVSSLLEY